jgi:hypothetical protein
MTTAIPPHTYQTAQVAIRSTRDIDVALIASLERGGLILSEEELCPEFFELRLGLAGEVFQKFVNYKGLLAIVVPDSLAYGERFSELMYEHRQHPCVQFFPDRVEAQKWLNSHTGRR